MKSMYNKALEIIFEKFSARGQARLVATKPDGDLKLTFTIFQHHGRGNTVFNSQTVSDEEKDHLDKATAETVDKFISELSKAGVNANLGSDSYKFKVDRNGRKLEVDLPHKDDKVIESKRTKTYVITAEAQKNLDQFFVKFTRGSGKLLAETLRKQSNHRQ